MQIRRHKRKYETFDIVNAIFMILLMIVMLFPYWYSLAGSFNDGTDYLRGGVYLWPRKFTTANYHAVFRDKTIFNSFVVTIFKSVIGTASSLFVTSLAAYALSRPQLKGKKFYIPYMMLTMYFGGGLIPYFILIKDVGLYDNFLVYIIPGLFSLWNMIIIRSFFVDLPGSLIESAKIDGAGYLNQFFAIMLPLVKPALSAQIVFAFVGTWNDYFIPSIYLNKTEVKTLQLQLLSLQQQQNNLMDMNMVMAGSVISSIPMLIVFTTCQKFFVESLAISGIKG